STSEASGKQDTTASRGKDGKDGKDKATDAAPAAEGEKIAEEDKRHPAAEAADDSEVDPAAAAELAALMAVISQSGPAADADPATAVTTAAGKAILAAGNAKSAAAEKTLVAEDDTLTVALDGKGKQEISGSGKQEATGKGEDFVAALDKAGTAAQGKVAHAAADAMRVTIEKTMTQAVKNMEVPAPQQVASTQATNPLQPLDQLQTQQAANRLMPHVGTQDWNQALGQKVIWMVQGEQQSATLTLNPPELGPMQVTLKMQHNQATANFTAPQPEVRQALEAAMPRLREMLNEAGIQLGRSRVHDGSAQQQGQGFADAQQHRHGSSNASSTAAMDATPVVSHIPVRGGNGMVDTFA